VKAPETDDKTGLGLALQRLNTACTAAIKLRDAATAAAEDFWYDADHRGEPLDIGSAKKFIDTMDALGRDSQGLVTKSEALSSLIPLMREAA
jgi:hypothetical protein